MLIKICDKDPWIDTMSHRMRIRTNVPEANVTDTNIFAVKQFIENCNDPQILQDIFNCSKTRIHGLRGSEIELIVRQTLKDHPDSNKITIHAYDDDPETRIKYCKFSIGKRIPCNPEGALGFTYDRMFLDEYRVEVSLTSDHCDDNFIKDRYICWTDSIELDDDLLEYVTQDPMDQIDRMRLMRFIELVADTIHLL
jgi:hypothetical protein